MIYRGESLKVGLGRLFSTEAINRNITVLAVTAAASTFSLSLWQLYLPNYLSTQVKTTVLVGAVYSFSGLVVALSYFISGWLGDSLGRKKVIVANSFLLGLAPLFLMGSDALLLGFGLLLFFWSTSSLQPVFRAMITDGVRASHRGRALSIFNSVAVSLAVLALILSGLRLESLGGSGIQSYSLQNMASLFMASAVIILLMSFVRLIFLSETYRPSNDDRATFSSVIAKNLAPLKKGNVRPLTLAYMLHDAALSMVLFLIPLYATRAGMAAFTLSTMFAVQIALTFILQIPFGRLADKKGRTWTILVSFVLEAIFAALLVVYANPYYAFAIYTVWIAAGQMDAPAQSALLADLTKIEERSSMMGGFGAVTTLAAIPAPIIGGFLFDVNLPLLFYICSTLLAIAAATMLYYRRHLLREPSHEVSL